MACRRRRRRLARGARRRAAGRTGRAPRPERRARGSPRLRSTRSSAIRLASTRSKAPRRKAVPPSARTTWSRASLSRAWRLRGGRGLGVEVRGDERPGPQPLARPRPAAPFPSRGRAYGRAADAQPALREPRGTAGSSRACRCRRHAQGRRPAPRATVSPPPSAVPRGSARPGRVESPPGSGRPSRPREPARPRSARRAVHVAVPASRARARSRPRARRDPAAAGLTSRPHVPVLPERRHGVVLAGRFDRHAEGEQEAALRLRRGGPSCGRGATCPCPSRREQGASSRAARRACAARH